MKKGIIGAIIGLVVFFFALNILIIGGPYYTIGFTIIPIIMFSLVIFIIAKVTKSASKQNNYQYHDNGVTRSQASHCVKCNALISSSDKYCPKCGSPQKDTIICEYCGHENPKSNALCENCNGFL